MFEACKYRIVLGSASPRRRALMAALGLDFTVMEACVDENDLPSGMIPEEIPVFLSKKKSEALMGQIADDQLLITADTIVALNGEVFGKPAERAVAVDMLKKLSGNRHEVITGVTIATQKSIESFSVKTDVFFRALDDYEIDYYVDHYQPYDKAGGYGIQEWIGYIGIDRIEGSFYNVMGLPVQVLFSKLKNYR